MSQSSVTPQTAPPRLHFRVPPEPSHLLRARERIRDYMTPHCTEKTVVSDVVLAVEEAATNAIRHSGSSDDIEILLGFEGHDLTATVKDKGRGFAVDTFDPDRLPDPLLDHGRGLFLISRLCDEMELCCDGGLEVRLLKRNVAPASGATDQSEALAPGVPGIGHDDARQRVFLEEIDELFAALDWEFRYIYVNARFCQITGLQADELLGKTLWELFPEILGTDVEERLLEAMNLGVPSRYEFYFPPLESWFEQRLYPTAYGINEFSVEITERKLKEQERDQYLTALRDSEHRLRRFYEAGLVGVIYWNTDGEIVDANDRFLEMVGYTREELRAGEIDWINMTPTDQRYLDERSLAELKATGANAVPFEKDYLRKDGTRVPVILASAMLDEERRNGVAFVLDNTERRRAEEALRQSEEKYRTMVETAAEGVVVAAPDGTYTYVNQRMADMLGYTPDEVLGKSIHDLTCDDGLRAQIMNARDGLRQGDAVHGEIEFRRKDGSSLWTAYSISPLRDGNGAHIGNLAMHTDISERKQAEEERQRLLAESQAQTEELQTQSEELQVQSEELQVQTEELRFRSDDLAERARLAEALNAINRLVNTALEPDAILQRALDAGVGALALDAGIIVMREESSWIVRHQHGFTEEDVGLHLSASEAPNATRSMERREPLTIPDMGSDPETKVGFARMHGLSSVLAVPIITKESVAGCLLLYGRRVRSFAETEIDFGRKLGATVSLAIENAQLFAAEVEAQREAAQELQTTGLLLEAATATTSWTDLDRMLESLGDLLLHATDHSRVLLELWDGERREVEIAVSRGAAATPKQRFAFDGISDGAKEVITTRKTLVVDYAATGIPGPQRAYVDEHAFLLMLVVPIVYRERLIGLITLDQPGEARPFSPREIELVEAIAAQAGAAIENARLFEYQQQAAKLNAALAAVDRVIHSSLDFAEVMQTALREGAAVIGAETAGIEYA